MKLRLNVALIVTVIGAAGCSSISMPSMPWSGSSLQADPSAEALFAEGMRNFNEKRYVRALDNFNRIKTDHPFSPLMTETELRVADAYYLNRQYPEAVNAFKEFQALHPTNENIPFVVLRLGQAHFDQFTATDRDQKNTEIAKGYFETVLSNYPKSPQAEEARAKLAKTLEYLAEHEFNIAYFYFQQEKYPAARDRFDEIIRKYRPTPTAVKSLFYLGECYRKEGNTPRAILAYEALLQHYPQSKFAPEAKTQLALVEKEKRDPLELVLMRDRRPAVAPEVKEDPALAKLKDVNLIAKKEVVHEDPGVEKSFFRRVADKINPFSSSDSEKKEPPKSENAYELLAKKNQAQKQESPGILSSLWPSAAKDANQGSQKSDAKADGVISKVDESLKQKGIDAEARVAATKPPQADLPKPDPAPAAPTDTVALLGAIDDKLMKSGKNPNELPAPPEAAAAFRDTAAVQAAVAAQQGPPATSTQDVQSSGILSSIDQKLQAKGLEPAKLDKPPTEAEIKTAAAPQRQQPKPVELEPKLALEKGPLFLSPAEVQPLERGPAEPDTTQSKPISETPGRVGESPNRVLVKGPVQSQPAGAAKPAETRKPGAAQEEGPKGVFDQLRQDMENVGKVLNPFSW
jgi:outer membrane protein assembly factor BamD